MADPPQTVLEPDPSVGWEFDRVARRYVRFLRRESGAYGRDPAEVLLDPEQLAHLIAWKRADA